MTATPYVEAIGEITNGTGKSFEFATFTIKVYSKSGELLDTGTVIINNFGMASQRLSCH